MYISGNFERFGYIGVISVLNFLSVCVSSEQRIQKFA